MTNLGARRRFPPPLLPSSPPPLLDSPAAVPRVESECVDGSELVELVGPLRREEGAVLIIHDRVVDVGRIRLSRLIKGLASLQEHAVR